MTAVDSLLTDALRDRYVIERELGRGGMATVYLAQDVRHDRPVALKVLHPELAASLGTERFLREIRTTARLDHPHILPVFDSGEAAGLLWYTMPYVEGENLRERLKREGQLPVQQAVQLAREVTDALDCAHAHGVVHRDIKPENILLSRGHARVADFGVARALEAAGAGSLTETGMAVGTPAYMAPEQATGGQVDPRSDIYALGCVLYEMLAGEPPFTGPSHQAILAKRLSEPVPHLGVIREVPHSIERAVTRSLARTPADRFPTASEFAAALAPNLLDPSPPTIPVRALAQKRGLRTAAVAGLPLLALLAWYVFLEHAGGGDEAPPASAAVLPFVDMSPQKDQEYFSDGLTEELITSLSQIKGLRVAAPTSSFQFKGRNTDVREVGRKLGVGAVLEGGVRRSENRLRVTAQLSSAKDGYQLWSDSYDRDLADVFAVQEEIARAIVAALQVRLAPGPDSALAARPTEDLQAYDLYLQGRFAWNQRTQAALPEAVRYFEQAVARDTTFARAYAGLADAYILLPPFAGVSPAVAWPRAKAAAAKALALDSMSAEAYTSVAYGTMAYEWDWPAAEESFRRAIAANPNYPTGHHWYGDFLAGRGRLEESMREMRRAHTLDPLSRQIGTELAWVYYLMHRSQEATEEIRRTLALDQNYSQAHFVLGQVQSQQGRYGEAIASLRRAVDLGGFHGLVPAALAYAYAASGDHMAAGRILKELRRRSAREYVSPFGFAVVYAGLGDTTRVLEWLERGIDQRDIILAESFFDPALDPFRRDPRFARLVDRMGLR